MAATPHSRAGRCRLWAHYALRPHPLTGRRIRRLRWHLDTGHSRPIWQLAGEPGPDGIRASWEWPA